MRLVGHCFLATNALLAVAAAPGLAQAPAAPVAAPPPPSATAAPVTQAAAAVNLGAVAASEAKAPGGITPESAAAVKGGVQAWRKGQYSQAVQAWQPLAERGDPDAQFNLAQAYKLGRGVPAADLKKAEDFYARAAAQGHEEARTNLGIILFQRGERTRGLPYVIKSAERGDARAQYIYGTALFNGDLIQKDWVKAYAMMTKSAAAGLPQAAESLSRMDSFIPAAQRKQGIALARTGVRPQPDAGKTVLASRPPVAPKPAPTAKPVQPTKPVQVAKAPPPPKPAPRPVQVAKAPQPQSKPVQMAKAPPPAPVARQGGQVWYVQLGAYSSRPAAVAAWKTARGKVPALGGVRGTLGQAGKMTRLRAGPVDGMAAAQRLCAAASRAGQPCFPVR